MTTPKGLRAAPPLTSTDVPALSTALDVRLVEGPGTPRRGRPRKFSRPSSALTITLPDDVIAALRTIDTDIGRAIVRLTEPRMVRPRPQARPISVVGDKLALVLTNPSRELEERTGAKLLPLSDGRTIVCLGTNSSVHELELRLCDSLTAGDLPPLEATLFEDLLLLLRHARSGSDIGIEERRIFLIQRKSPSTRARRAGGA